jgi:hypothetical protein
VGGAWDESHLVVVGVLADGRLMMTVRRPDGWDGWTDVLASIGRNDLVGKVIDVAVARRIPEFLEQTSPALYLFLALRDAPPVLYVQEYAAGAEQFFPVPRPSADFPAARRVAVAVTRRVTGGTWEESQSELRLGAVTFDGRILVALRTDETVGNAAASDIRNHGTGDRGTMRCVAVAPRSRRFLGSPVLLGVTAAGGRVFSTDASRSSLATTAWADVDNGVPGVVRPVVDVAVQSHAVGLFGQASSTLSIAAVSGDGRAWLANNSGTWQAWEDLETTIVTVTGGPWTVTTTGLADVGDLLRISLGETVDGLHVVGLTADGRIWHQLRPSESVAFRDIQSVGVGQVVGGFTAIACA